MFNATKTLKITEYDGNNAKTVVSLIRGVVSSLINLVNASGQSALPYGFDNYLLDGFKITSVNNFNTRFEHYSITTSLNKSQTKMYNKLHISDILSLPETQYCHLYSIGQWSGVNTKINATSFNTITN